VTGVRVLPTPSGWPRFLLPAAAAGDPTDLDDAVSRGAFAALRSAIGGTGPDGVLAALERSGLRGEAGPGPTTAAKWRACAAVPADERYVVVNAYQADPAVFTDRVLLERNPYAVIEGAAIAAFAVGASEVIVALRAEASDAIRTLEAAVSAAEKAGYLGSAVLGSAVEIRVSVRPLSGAYMLGEETVLLKGLEGRRGQPEQQPPYVTTRGLWGRPTLVHGPQTFAAVPRILTGSGAALAQTGTESDPGTILVQVSGAVVQPGVLEVPIGTPIGAIVRAAGGLPAHHQLKAVLVGGPSGGILPRKAVTIGYDAESLDAAGAHFGSGSIVVIDQRACVVDLAAALTRFCADQACGKTIPCRIGLRRLAEIGARICEGEPRGDEVARLDDLASDIVESALCDHERRATLALRSVVRYFRAELDDHLIRNTCPAGVCPMTADAPAGAVR
jgi:NADH-quinone oxidoreductase subunit F